MTNKTCTALAEIEPSAEIARLREALNWYGEMALKCRKLTSEGDNARIALDRDGGAKARKALSALPDDLLKEAE